MGQATSGSPRGALTTHFVSNNGSRVNKGEKKSFLDLSLKCRAVYQLPANVPRAQREHE